MDNVNQLIITPIISVIAMWASRIKIVVRQSTTATTTIHVLTTVIAKTMGQVLTYIVIARVDTRDPIAHHQIQVMDVRLSLVGAEVVRLFFIQIITVNAIQKKSKEE